MIKFEIPTLEVGQTYEIFDEVQLIVLTDDQMLILGPFGMMDIFYNELVGLWVS